MALSVLGSATCSVLDFVRTDLRTMRLAIALQRPQRQHPAPSQGAGSHPIYPMRRAKETSELGRTIQCHSLSEALTLMLPPERT